MYIITKYDYGYWQAHTAIEAVPSAPHLVQLNGFRLQFPTVADQHGVARELVFVGKNTGGG